MTVFKRNIDGDAGILPPRFTNASHENSFTGINDDGSVNISNLGGIVGHLDNSNVSSVINAGNIYGEKSTGGLVGNVNNDTMPTNTKTLANSYNKGQVSGIDNTGGIAGEATNASFDTVYNTNESSTLIGILAAMTVALPAVGIYAGSAEASEIQSSNEDTVSGNKGE